MSKRKQQLTIHYECFSSVGELEPLDAQLLLAARAATKLAYAPYSNFRVGAAGRLANGEILKAGNQENAAYPMCLCAEQVLISAASSQYPKVAIEAIAITVASAKGIKIPVSPCGACRQILSETEEKLNHGIRLILQGEDGDIWILESARELLPFAFGGEVL